MTECPSVFEVSRGWDYEGSNPIHFAFTEEEAMAYVKRLFDDIAADPARFYADYVTVTQYRVGVPYEHKGCFVRSVARWDLSYGEAPNFSDRGDV